nr:hypothetical protein CFP56_30821 [Quercus suber]
MPDVNLSIGIINVSALRCLSWFLGEDAGVMQTSAGGRVEGPNVVMRITPRSQIRQWWREAYDPDSVGRAVRVDHAVMRNSIRTQHESHTSEVTSMLRGRNKDVKHDLLKRPCSVPWRMYFHRVLMTSEYPKIYTHVLKWTLRRIDRAIQSYKQRMMGRWISAKDAHPG